MIVKIKLLESQTPDHPFSGKELSGYSEHAPELGHPILIWYNDGNESAYFRTSRVRHLLPMTQDGIWIALTDHSTYKIQMLSVKRGEEEGIKAASVLKNLVGNIIDLGK